MATAGHDLRCRFWQNWEIPQAEPKEIYSCEVPLKMVVRQAQAVEARSTAYTYTEPTVFYVVENTVKKGACPYCGAPIPGIWE
jgi:pyruvate formate lyase activating enzyme